MQLLGLLRPSCSAAVRHQARLELLFAYLPLLGSIVAGVSGSADDSPSRFQAFPLFHFLGAVVLVSVGVLLWKKNSLPSVAHYFEDPLCSNALCECFSWLPIAVTCPMLVTGHAQDIALTFLDMFSATVMYAPLLEAPLQLIARYAAYTGLACARMLHLMISDPDSHISLPPYIFELLLVGACAAMALQIRLRYLSLKSTPLTPECLEESSRSTATGRGSSHRCLQTTQEPMWLRSKAGRHRQTPQEYMPLMADRNRGEAGVRFHKVWMRRQRYKAEVMGRLLWAIHMVRQTELTSEVLDNIISFLHESERPVTEYVGLLWEDARSMISGSRYAVSSSTCAFSSLSSVALLRTAVSARWWLAFDWPRRQGEQAHG
ncbi:unnamed protein product [Symbiodinium sp. CCMP2592]|nr:unnamed protein product [Symbiodinium sp. CCMP2592]